MNKNQHGFTLVSVMILTVMASVVVFTSLKDSVVQERLSGNFQKKTNAQMMSERAVFAQAQAIKQQMLANPDASLDDLVANTSSVNSYSEQAGDLKYQARVSKNAAGELEVSAAGERYNKDAQATLVARYGMSGSAGSSVFKHAIVGCEGVSLSASGRIDSFDSNNGSYIDQEPGFASTVGTIYQDADVTLSGSSPIWGSVQATGNISLTGSSPVIGSLHANGKILINAGPNRSNADVIPDEFPDSTIVSGNVSSFTDIELRNGHVLGVLRANETIYLSNSGGAIIDNHLNDGLDVQYGHSLSKLSNGLHASHEQNGHPYDDADYFGIFPNVAFVPAVNPDDLPDDYDATDPNMNCDPLQLGDTHAQMQSPSSPDLMIEHGTSNISRDHDDERALYLLTPNQGRSAILTADNQELAWLNWMGDQPSDISGDLETVEGQSVLVLKAGSLTLNNGVLLVRGGDVSLFIDGDFTVQGQSSIEIEPGSSLTMYITGKTRINAGDDSLLMAHHLTESKRPPWSIFSSYDGDEGMVIEADADFYATIYAPFTNVDVNADGEFSGSVRGKSVNISGDGAIHYDVALGEASSGTTGGSQKLVFLGWKYKSNKNPELPDDESP